MIKDRQNKFIFRRFINSLIIFSIILFSLTACGKTEPEALRFDNQNIIIQPGGTSQFKIIVLPENNEGKAHFPNNTIKIFSKEPEVSLTGKGLSIKDITLTTNSENISAIVILSAGENLLSGQSSNINISWGGFSANGNIQIKKDPRSFIDANSVITDPAAYDALINKQRRLPGDYIPEDLVRVEVPTILTFEEVNHLRKIAADALKTMFEAAEKENGYNLVARSGYRSYSTQVSLFKTNVAAHGQDYADRFSARPGTSEHQSGLAMDITTPGMNYQLEQSFGITPEGLWVRENAHRFGFIIRYPEGKENITGYSYEPWHLRYTGKELAEIIYRENLTLEEYFNW